MRRCPSPASTRRSLRRSSKPIALGEMPASDDAAADRVTEAFLQMNKLDIAALEKACRNEQG